MMTQTQASSEVTEKIAEEKISEQLLNCAVLVCLLGAAIIIFIFVAGLIDLYGNSSWNHITKVITLDATNIWPATGIGLFGQGCMAWAICGMWNLVRSEQITCLWAALLLVVMALGFTIWLLCLSATRATLSQEGYAPPTGFLFWAHQTLYIPHIVAAAAIWAMFGWAMGFHKPNPHEFP